MREIIVSRQNPLVKTVFSLLEKKHRRSMKLFRFDGVKLFSEAVLCGLKIEYVVLSESANAMCKDSVALAIKEGKISEDAVYRVSASVFEKISEENSPEGIITVVGELSSVKEKVSALELSRLINGGDLILMAESLRDPGNLGTVIRSCATLGINRLVLSSDCADIYNPKTIRAAMGGLFRLDICILEAGAMPSAIIDLRSGGRRVYATALKQDSVDINALPLKKGDCFVIGNEGHGLSESVVGACDASCIIPMRAGCESLNASAAAAICIWETVRAL